MATGVSFQTLILHKNIYNAPIKYILVLQIELVVPNIFRLVLFTKKWCLFGAPYLISDIFELLTVPPNAPFWFYLNVTILKPC